MKALIIENEFEVPGELRGLGGWFKGWAIKQ